MPLPKFNKTADQGNWIMKVLIELSSENCLIMNVELSSDNAQVPSSDIITSLFGYSSLSEAWKVFDNVNSGASAL